MERVRQVWQAGISFRQYVHRIEGLCTTLTSTRRRESSVCPSVVAHLSRFDSLQLLRSGRQRTLGRAHPGQRRQLLRHHPHGRRLRLRDYFQDHPGGDADQAVQFRFSGLRIPLLSPSARQEWSILRRYVVGMRVLDHFLGHIQETEHGDSFGQLQPAPARQRRELLWNLIVWRGQPGWIRIPHVGGGSSQNNLQLRLDSWGATLRSGRARQR
jgi:hypothetical protein